MKPTTTTNRIHFSDLDPLRFEDLCLGLIFSTRPWSKIDHTGRSGSDGGIDIRAEELLENGTVERWRLQARRFSKASAQDLRKALDDLLATPGPVDVVVVVLGCDVSATALAAFEKHASARGIGRAQLWTASILEAKLYSERKDLLFAFFGVSLASETRSAERALVRNIGLRRRMRDRLLQKSFSDSHATYVGEPSDRFVDADVIIHSIDDKFYPNAATEGARQNWYKARLYALRHDGVEIHLHNPDALVDDEGRWALVSWNEYDRVPRDHPLRIPVRELGLIPYGSVVEFDESGDEYYQAVHMYCRFDAPDGTPYASLRYRSISADAPFELPPERRTTLDAFGIK